jgi:ABC-type multidrug transport system fused ATPase/permease subunit
MRVHQAGGYLMQARGADVDDWSWGKTRRRLGLLWRLTLPYRGRTALSVVSLLTATATALAPPYLAKLALDDAIKHRGGTQLYVVVAIFVAAGLANWGMTYVETYFTGWVGERILADLRNRVFEHLQKLSLGFYERNRAGVIISRLTNDVEAIDQLVTDGVTSLVQNTLTLIGTAIILFVLDWRLALATCAVVPLISIATAIFRTRSARAYAAVRERLGLVTATLAEDIAGMRVLQAFTREEPAYENFRQVAGHYREANMRTVVLNALYFPVVDLLSSVALVGHTGAGKSTIAKLLARFYEPTHGRITIDGLDLNDVRQASLRSQLGVVPQEGFLFAGTVAENIAFGKPNATADEIVRAAQTVGAHDFVLRLEDGYETQLGERGTRLSLGQRQLVAFARALLADPRILILDEATSSVDIGTERRIEQALGVLLADRTAFIIAHRLSTIRNADLIVVLEHGRIVEQGSHDELLERRGLYTSLYGDWASDAA